MCVSVFVIIHCLMFSKVDSGRGFQRYREGDVKTVDEGVGHR